MADYQGPYSGAQVDAALKAATELQPKVTEIDGKLTELSEEVYTKREQVREVDVPLSFFGGYYSPVNGMVKTDSSRCSTDKIEVAEGEQYLISTIIGGSTAIAYLAQWNGDTFVGVAEGFTGGSGNAERKSYIVPSGVDTIAICSYNTTQPSLIKVEYTYTEEVSFYKKNETYTKEEVDEIVGVKVYGVRCDLSDPSITSWERTRASVGMVASVQQGDKAAEHDDFLSVYPFNAIKECNIIKLSNGATKIIYKGEEGFSLANDTFIEFPLWYEKRYIKDGYEHREICEQQAGGFYPSPMFVEDGKVLDRVYVAKYETSNDAEGVAKSVTNAEPTSYKTLAEFRDMYKAKGEGFAGMDIRTIMSLQHLYLVRFADKNSQNYVGGGYTNLNQPYGGGCKDYSGLTSGEVVRKNYVVTYPSASHAQSIMEWYWVGKQIGFVKSNEQFMYDRATITDMQISSDGKSVTIYFDKEVEIITEAADAAWDNSDMPVRTWFGGCGQNTGRADNITHDTGRTELGASNNNGSCAVKLFGIENLWGNLWHETEGILFIGNYAYIARSQEAHSDYPTNFQPIATPMVEQNQLGSVGAQFCFIGNMWLDNAFPWLAYPSSVRGGTPTDTSKPTSGITQDNGYGDAYYFDSTKNNGESIEVFGGGFDHYERAGLFCHRCWNGVASKWYLQGSRMQFKNL